MALIVKPEFGNYSKRSIIGFFAIAALICMLVLAYWNNQSLNARKESLSLSVIGTIKYVVYDVKGIPYITVNNEDFYLGSGYNFDHQIQKGDSVIKKKGSNVYRIIKTQYGEVLEFKN